MSSFSYFSKHVRFPFPSVTLKKLCVSAEQKSCLDEVTTGLLKSGNRLINHETNI